MSSFQNLAQRNYALNDKTDREHARAIHGLHPFFSNI